MQVKRTALILLTVLSGYWSLTVQAQSANRRCVPPVPVPQDRWRGEYFANRELSGTPVLVRDEGVGDLFFDSGLNAPDKECGVPVDDFSVRWARVAAFAPGTYRFSVTADDGVRVKIDDRVVIDEWHEQAMPTRSADVDLTGGAHRIVIEYFEHLGSAALKFNWSRTPCLAKVTIDHWRGEYFANRELSGPPLLVSDDGVGLLDFDWGLAGPSATCLTLADNFSARWTRTFAFAPGFYRFKVNADDGVRLFIDKQLKLDQWTPQRGEHIVEVELSGGNHQLVLEYFEQYGSAEVGLRWERHPCLATVAADHWKGEYFAASDLTGALLQIRDEGDGPLELAFGKARGRQRCLDREEFSARWTRKVTFANGIYRFTVEARERVRFLLDGETLVDQWQEPKASPTFVDVTVPAGNHRLTLEYAKVPGDSAVRLRWEAVARALPLKR
jgi:hypothetical protein